MAIPTIATDLTEISLADSTTNWTITGMGGIDTEIQVEGAGCLYIEAKSTDAIQGAMYDMGTPIDLSGSDRLFMRLFIASQGFLYSMATGGVSVRMEDSNGYWAEWNIGGNDVQWNGEGWKTIIQDANQTPDETGGGGSFDPADVKEVGFSCWYTAQLKGPAAAIDAVYYGTYVEITGKSHTDGSNGITLNENGASEDTIVRLDGGSWITDGFENGDTIVVSNATTSDNDGEYVITAAPTAGTLTIGIDDFTSDETADLTVIIDLVITWADIIANDVAGYGLVWINKAAVYELCGTIYIGDISGAEDTYFKTTNERIVWNDQFIPTGESQIIAAEDTGRTMVVFGEYDGSGDNRVGYAGSYMYAAKDIWGVSYGLDFSSSVTICNIYGSLFANADDGMTLSASATDNEFISNTITLSGEFNPDDAVVRRCFFTSTTSDSSAAAILWSTNTDLDNCSFLVNTGTNVSAIRHTDGTTRTYYDLLFSGNTYDVFLNHASADLTINKDGTSNPSTSRSSGSGSVTFVGTVTLQLTVKDESGTAIVDARCLMEAGDGAGAAPFEDVVTITSSGATATVTHTTHGLTDGQMVNIRSANEPEYNGAGKVITWVDVDTYEYTISGGPASPATGTITSTQCFMSEVTVAGGIATESFNAGATQAYRGRVAYTEGATIYKDVTFSGTDVSGGLNLPIQMASDEG